MLLFDEPLSNLDAKLREQMRIETSVTLQQRSQSPAFTVHPDQSEATEHLRPVVVMRDGRVEQEGTPLELFTDRPKPFRGGVLSVRLTLWKVSVSAEE